MIEFDDHVQVKEHHKQPKNRRSNFEEWKTWKIPYEQFPLSQRDVNEFCAVFCFFPGRQRNTSSFSQPHRFSNRATLTNYDHRKAGGFCGNILEHSALRACLVVKFGGRCGTPRRRKRRKVPLKPKLLKERRRKEGHPEKPWLAPQKTSSSPPAFFVTIFIVQDFESGVRFSTAKLRSRKLRQVFRQQNLYPAIFCYSSTGKKTLNTVLQTTGTRCIFRLWFDMNWCISIGFLMASCSGLQALDFFSTLDTFSFEPRMPQPAVVKKP